MQQGQALLCGYSGNACACVELEVQIEIEWFEGERQAFRPPPKMKVSEWADERRVLQPGTSRRSGPWSTGTTPYLREPMDTYNEPGVRHIVLCFGTQLGKTECLYNIQGFIIDLVPYSTLLMYPREDDAKGISRSRLQPMIEACPTLREKKPSKADLYQTLEMHFPGMVLYLVGANSAAALAQKPCLNVLRDEINKYPDFVGKDADPLSLSEERAKSFWDIRKIVDVSSPTLEHCGISKQLQTCDEVRHYQMPCPFCGHLQALLFERIKWDKPEDEKASWSEKVAFARNTAYYECVECAGRIGDEHKSRMLAEGFWEAEKLCAFEPEGVGFQLSSLYSPWLTFGDIAAQFLKAKQKQAEEGDLTALQNFINGWLAEPWRAPTEKPEESKILARRCELPPLVVPAGVVALTCGVDMQKYGFYYTVWAWTRRLESWLIHYGRVTNWPEVQELVFSRQYPIENSNHTLCVWRAALDTGGGEGDEGWSRTEEAYAWLRENGRGVVWGVKGLSKNTHAGTKIRHTTVDKMPGKDKRPIPGGLVLWLLDTYQLKEAFFWRLTSSSPDHTQHIHFHAETDQGFVSHLLSEEKCWNPKKGAFEYQRMRGENHYLDCSIYAHACADPQWAGGVLVLPDPVFDTSTEEESTTTDNPYLAGRPNPFSGR